jgi:hypothetical protein
MSEYVRIASSPAEIMGIAAQISARGKALKDRVGALNEAIATHESPGEVFPSDQFTDPFVEKYRRPTAAANGTTTPSNVAVRESALYCASKLQDMGDFVGTAMMNYGAADDEGGADIRNTAV